MKAIVFHDIGDIRLEEVDEPQIQDPTDAIVRLTSSAICVEAVAKADTVSIIGVYPPTVDHFPIGQATMKNLTLKMGNCNQDGQL